MFDRLLARMLATNPQSWVVKGGVALDLRLGDNARTTKDLDLARRDSLETTIADLIHAQGFAAGDFFEFSIERLPEPHLAAEQSHARFRVRAELAGRLFEEVALDVGFEDELLSAPDMIVGTRLLHFADLKPIVVPTLAVEQHAAEKFHAYTRTYSGGRGSSHVKDLLDLVLIQSLGNISSSELRRAVDAIFATRNTHAKPATVPPPPDNWALAYRKLAQETGFDPNISAGYRRVTAFLEPILANAIIEPRTWNPSSTRWEQIDHS